MKKQISEPFSFHPFEGLKKTLESRAASARPEPAVKDQPAYSCEDKLFADAMKDVREIREFRSIPASRPGPCIPCRKRSDDPPDREALKALDELVRGRRPVILQDTQEYVEWVHPDYRRVIIEQLREGRFSVQDTVDLHGLVLEEAEVDVRRFLKECLKRRFRCIKIIHGRGLRSPNGPVVKAMVADLLSRCFRKDIIAFVTARQCDGGLGAVYVLLR